LVVSLALSACGGQATPTTDTNAMMTLAFATVNAAGTQTFVAMPTNTVVPTNTPAPTPTPKPEFLPTVVLTATVSIPSNVRFGPGTEYAGPGGLRTGKTIEVIGRNAAGDWLLVREVGGKKSSWVYAANLTVQGDIASLAIAPVILPITPNYAAPTNIRAARSGDQVQVMWDAVEINYKDVYPESSYFLETWLCTGGQLVYSIHAVKETSIILTDQPGCAEKSHGLLYTTTRDGYGGPAEITPWP
jgi:hypothetical protein